MLNTDLDLLRPLITCSRSRSPVRVRSVIDYLLMLLFSLLCNRVAQDAAPESTEAAVSRVLSAPPLQDVHAVGRGPRAAIRAWSNDKRSVSESAAWLEEARLQAILGSSSRSLNSIKSVHFVESYVWPFVAVHVPGQALCVISLLSERSKARMLVYSHLRLIGCWHGLRCFVAVVPFPITWAMSKLGV